MWIWQFGGDSRGGCTQQAKFERTKRKGRRNERMRKVRTSVFMREREWLKWFITTGGFFFGCCDRFENTCLSRTNHPPNPMKSVIFYKLRVCTLYTLTVSALFCCFNDRTVFIGFWKQLLTSFLVLADFLVTMHSSRNWIVNNSTNFYQIQLNYSAIAS